MDGSYWKIFYRELCLFKRNKTTTIWKKGFETLQNIENCHLLQHDAPKRLDYVTKYTINKLDTNGKSKNRNATTEEEKNIADIPG